MRFTGFFGVFEACANDSSVGSAMAIPPARRKFLRVNEVFMGLEEIGNPRTMNGQETRRFISRENWT